MVTFAFHIELHIFDGAIVTGKMPFYEHSVNLNLLSDE